VQELGLEGWALAQVFQNVRGVLDLPAFDSQRHFLNPEAQLLLLLAAVAL